MATSSSKKRQHPSQSAREKEFLEAYEQHSDALFRHCYFRTFNREAAKDHVQEAFCRTWKYISKGNVVDNIRAFLYKTANNIIIDESRKKKSISLNYLMEKGFSPRVDAHKATENFASSKEVLAVIRSLDKKYRDVLLLKYVDGFSAKEIAKLVDDSESNVYIKIHRGIRKVKWLLMRHNLD